LIVSLTGIVIFIAVVAVCLYPQYAVGVELQSVWRVKHIVFGYIVGTCIGIAMYRRIACQYVQVPVKRVTGMIA